MRKLTTFILLLMLVSISSNFAQRQKMGGSEEAVRQTTRAAGRQAVAETGEDNKTTKDLDISKTPIKGVVVSLKAMTLGDGGEISQDAARELAAKGEPLLFKSGGKYYYIFDTNKEYWGMKLANYAGLSEVGIYGAKATYNGVNVIVAARIVSLE